MIKNIPFEAFRKAARKKHMPTQGCDTFGFGHFTQCPAGAYMNICIWISNEEAQAEIEGPREFKEMIVPPPIHRAPILPEKP